MTPARLSNLSLMDSKFSMEYNSMDLEFIKEEDQFRGGANSSNRNVFLLSCVNFFLKKNKINDYHAKNTMYTHYIKISPGLFGE